jgi:hypothetical protein
MQYYTVLSVLAGAAAVSAQGLTSSLLGSSLTGAASGSASGDAKGDVTGLPTDDLLEGLTGDATNATASNSTATGPLALLDGLKMKELLQPSAYSYEDPVTSTYSEAIPTATFITRTVTASESIPTWTAPADPSTNTTVDGVASCSEGTSTSCCDTKDASGGFLSNILGGSCALSNLNVPVLAVGGLSGSQCNNGNTFCCPINQDVSLAILYF